MVQRIVKLLGVSAPILSLIIAYQIWFGFKYTGVGSDSPMQTITALQFALEEGSSAILFWPVFIFVLSVVGAFGAWKMVKPLVWVVALTLLVVALTLLVVSVLGVWSIGLVVAPLALLFVVIGILLLYSDFLNYEDIID